MSQKYWHHTGTRDALGERKLNEGKEFSNHTTILTSLRKGEERKGERMEGGKKGDSLILFV